MSFIGIQPSQGFEKRLPLRSREVLAGEGGKERIREIKRAVGIGHLLAQSFELRFRKFSDAALARVAVGSL